MEVRSSTVAILAQGTHWAVAVTQAFLIPGSIPGAVRFLPFVVGVPPLAASSNVSKRVSKALGKQVGPCETKRRRGGIEPLHVSMPRELKSRPSTRPTHPGRRLLLLCFFVPEQGGIWFVRERGIPGRINRTALGAMMAQGPLHDAIVLLLFPLRDRSP